MQVNILAAKNRLSQLIRATQAGQDVVIANRGKPVARMIPVHAAVADAGPRDFLEWLAGHPLPSHAQRGHDEIEAGIDAERHAWD